MSQRTNLSIRSLEKSRRGQFLHNSRTAKCGQSIVRCYALVNLKHLTNPIAVYVCGPLNFQFTRTIGAAGAGAYLVPSVAGNTTGALLTGYFVKNSVFTCLPTA